MYQFFVESGQIGKDSVMIEGSDVNHIKNVLRMKTGEEILISTGETMEYTCYIEEFLEDEVTAHIMYAQEAGYELLLKSICFRDFQSQTKWNGLFKRQ